MKEIYLPETVVIEVEEIDRDLEDGDEVAEFVADYLSDHWGFCVNNFCWGYEKGIPGGPIWVEDIDWDTSE